MGENVIKKHMIKSTIERAIDDLKTDTKRTTRRLVDLGELFSTGKYQRGFFTNAQKEFESDKSIYFELISKAVKSIDSKTLLKCGINIAYNGWVSGATIIRETEKKEGYNIPWTVIFDFSDGMLPSQDIAHVISQGQKLGITNYDVILTGNKREFDFTTLIDIFENNDECIFPILVDPESFSESLADRCCESKVIIPFFNSNNRTSLLDDSIAHIKKRKALYGLFSNTNDENEFDESIQFAKSKDALIMLFLQDDFFVNELSKKVLDFRNNMELPILPIDVYSDIAMADGNISSEPYLFIVNSTGNSCLVDFDKKEKISTENIKDTSLQQIFSTHAKKHS